MSSLLREAKAALGSSKGDLEVTMANHIKTLDKARKVDSIVIVGYRYCTAG